MTAGSVYRQLTCDAIGDVASQVDCVLQELMTIKIHYIQTGDVQIKTCHQRARHQARPMRRSFSGITNWLSPPEVDGSAPRAFQICRSYVGANSNGVMRYLDESPA